MKWSPHYHIPRFSGDGYWVVVDENGDKVAVVEDCDGAEEARLLAAAPEMYDHHRANQADAAAVVEAIADERWADARALAGAVARRSEKAVTTAEGARHE